MIVALIPKQDTTVELAGGDHFLEVSGVLGFS